MSKLKQLAKNSDDSNPSADLRVRVVMPAFNAAPFLSQSVLSIIGQSYKNWHLIIIDDGSSDNTLSSAQELAASDSRVTVLHQDNAGPASARNRGLFFDGPEWDCAAFLDADDIWDHHALSVLVYGLTENPDLPAAHAYGEFIDQDGEPICVGDGEKWVNERRRILLQWRLPCCTTKPTTFNILAHRDCIWVGAIIVRKWAVESTRGFDETLRASEDYDLWLRVAALGPIAYIPSLVMWYRCHPGNLSADRQLMHDSCSEVLQRALALPYLSPGQVLAAKYGSKLLRAQVKANSVCSPEHEFIMAGHFFRHLDLPATGKYFERGVRKWYFSVKSRSNPKVEGKI